MKFARSILVLSALASMVVARAASAEENHTRTPLRDGVTFGPVAGVTTGSFFKLPVQRLSLGFEAGRRWPSTLTVLGGARVEPGRTENGLGAHRLELGATVSGGQWLRVGAGAHLAYAMIVRVTESSALAKSLIGNIGGFGLGAHARAGFEVPLPGVQHLELFARALVEVYPGGNSWQIGPSLALWF